MPAPELPSVRVVNLSVDVLKRRITVWLGPTDDLPAPPSAPLVINWPEPSALTTPNLSVALQALLAQLEAAAAVRLRQLEGGDLADLVQRAWSAELARATAEAAAEEAEGRRAAAEVELAELRRRYAELTAAVAQASVEAEADELQRLDRELGNPQARSPA